MRCENVNSFLCLSLIHGKHHSDSHVIDIEHLTMLDIAMLLQETENRKNLPSSLIHMNTLALLKDTRDVLIESAGDVGNTMDVTVPDDIQNLFHINSGRGQCYLSERFVTQFRINLMKIESRIRENLADKTETIGMNTGRSDSHEDITHLDLRSVNESGLLDNSRGIAGDIILSVTIHTWHLGSLTSDKRTSGLTASLCHT